jgi:hypothetical protein
MSNHSLHRNDGSDKHIITFTSYKHVVVADRACKDRKGIQQPAENRKSPLLLSSGTSFFGLFVSQVTESNSEM